MTQREVQRSIETIWKMESTKIIASLTRMVRDLSFAEDIAQDALVIALERWTKSGIPANPAGWLMVVAKRRAIDLLRRNKVRDRKYEEIAHEIVVNIDHDASFDQAIEDSLDDDVLRLIFMTCHPILSPEARVALTLRLFGGLTTKEIAHAFLVPEPTVAQRIVRAKRSLSVANVPFELPEKSELTVRLSSVLEVIYLMFNEGYAATSGDSWTRPLLCAEALRLGRIVAEMLPGESEVHGLTSLMEIQSSRLHARVNSAGEPILLMDQNRALWDHLLIRRGLAALEKAKRCGVALGPYALQAAIAACHAEARKAEETDWVRIAALYDALAQVAPSPVVELNRAVALSMAFGPEVGLEIVEVLMNEPALSKYHLLPSVYGDLLFKLGRYKEAEKAFRDAAMLANNTREHELLLSRASACELKN